MAKMTGTEAKTIVSLELELNKANRKISELEQLLTAHEEAAARRCNDCELCRRADCYTLFLCSYLGYVDPEGRGCQKWKEKISCRKTGQS